LDGCEQVGDVGFDPLGFSSIIDMRWLREAELKHGRVCMLAATGMIVQDVYTFPGVTKTFGKRFRYVNGMVLRWKRRAEANDFGR